MIALTIFLKIIVPIFILIGIGSLMDKLFNLDIPTLSKLNFYVFVPALTFMKLLEADLSAKDIMNIGVFSFCHMAVMFIFVMFLYYIKVLKDNKTIVSLASVFANCGNFGIPLTALAFGNNFVGVNAILIMTQNLITFTFGIWLMEKGKRHSFKVFLGLFKIPVIYAIVFALIIRWLHIDLIKEIRQPLFYLSEGLIPIALLTLGAQLSRSTISENFKPVSAILLLRLILSPIIAVGLVLIFGFKPPISSVLILAAGLPVAVNIYILSCEYDHDQNLTSQSIFWTTLISSITLTLIIYLIRSFA